MANYRFTIEESTSGNSVVISDGDENKTIQFPKGKLSAIAHKGDNQSVDLRLMASRKNILSFRYDQCNLAESNAQETAVAISDIL